MENPVKPVVPEKSNNPVSSPAQSTSVQVSPAKDSFFKKRKKLIIAGIILIVILIGLFLISRKYGPLADKSMIPGSVSNPNLNSSTGAGFSQEKPKSAIAKVGEEYIFQEDLDVELANYIGNKDENTKKLLTDKLVKDSIILQAAKKENLATVSGEIFNSSLKNYGKRFETLKALETDMNNKVPQISGVMVSVWFHNYFPAKIGLEAGKQEAYKRITALQKRVAEKEITIEQAGGIIGKDPSYEDLDMGYKNNALIPFSAQKGERITVGGDFDTILWNTKAGGVTGVYLGKDTNGFTGAHDEEAYYVFGQVNQKIDAGSNQDFDAWYESQKNNYEVIYY